MKTDHREEVLRMAFSSNHEMERIYQESIQACDYSGEGTINKRQKNRFEADRKTQTKTKVARSTFQQDVHRNVEQYSMKKKSRMKNQQQYVKMQIITIIAIVIFSLLIVLLPLIIMGE